jgi:hypothetical protein
MGVVRLEITRREPVLDGAAFKGAGGAGSAYEKLEGVLHFSADRRPGPTSRSRTWPSARARLVEYSADSTPRYRRRPAAALDVPTAGARSRSAFNSPALNTRLRGTTRQWPLMRHGYTVA